MMHLPPPPAPQTSLRPQVDADAVVRVTELLDLQDEDVFDRSPNRTFDRVTRMAERLLGVPMAMISLAEDGTQRIAGAGLPDEFADRRRSSPAMQLLRATAAEGTQLTIEDTTALDGGHDLDRVGIGSFAGQPLVASTGETVGVLCVVAHEPRPWTADDQQTLADLAAIASAEVELHARAGRLAQVAARLGTIAAPLEQTEDAVASLANIADRAGDPRVERLASLAKERLQALRTDTATLHGDLGHMAGRHAAASNTAVNLGVRLLRAAKLANAALPTSTLRVEVLDRPLTLAGDGLAYERRLLRLLGAVAAQAGDADVLVEASRDGSEAVVRLRWDQRVPVPELARLASLAQAVRSGDTDSSATLATLGGRTTTTLEHGEAATGADGTEVVARMPLRSEAGSGATAPVPTPGMFPWGQ